MLGVLRGGATGAGGGDRLPVRVIDEIPGREHPGQVRPRRRVRDPRTAGRPFRLLGALGPLGGYPAAEEPQFAVDLSAALQDLAPAEAEATVRAFSTYFQVVNIAERVHRIVTLGSPHHGTWLARFALSRNSAQMRQASRWLHALAAREPAERSEAIQHSHQTRSTHSAGSSASR